MSEYPQGVWNRHQTKPLPCTVELERLSVGALLLDDFKAHLRVSGTAEDTLLTRWLNVAARALEDDTRRLLLTGTVKEYYDVWPWDYLVTVQLTRAPVVSVTSVTYYDTSNVLQTWSSSDYQADTLSEPARIVMAETPTLVSPNVDERPNAVVIEYECGYGSAVSSLPPESVNAVMMKAAYLYARGRELGGMADADAVERCWQNEIRRLTWSAY